MNIGWNNEAINVADDNAPIDAPALVEWAPHVDKNINETTDDKADNVEKP
jgi:hypothetical protein